MSEKSIIFNGENIWAILAGTKTQTRRAIKPQFGMKWGSGCPNQKGFAIMQPLQAKNWRDTFAVHTDLQDERGQWLWLFCPYGKIGTKLWVREAFRVMQHGFDYKADHEYRIGFTWKPSIHMPRAASRITLEITNVRAERLNDISEADAIAEGIEVDECNHVVRKDDVVNWGGAVSEFTRLWDKINGKKYPWASNPYVWVIEFKKV